MGAIAIDLDDRTIEGQQTNKARHAVEHVANPSGGCVAVGQAFIPPSTVRFAPVMYEDSGPATKATIAAISSGRP